MEKAQQKSNRVPNTPVEDYLYYLGMSIMLSHRGYFELAHSYRIYARDIKSTHAVAFA
jgi:hypothetical protein